MKIRDSIKISFENDPLKRKDVVFLALTCLTIAIFIAIHAISNATQEVISVIDFDFITNEYHREFIILYFLYWLVFYISLKDANLMSKIKSGLWGMFQVASVISVFVVIYLFPIIDSVISSVTHTSADYFNYARLRLSFYSLLFLLSLILSVPMFFVSLFLLGRACSFYYDGFFNKKARVFFNGIKIFWYATCMIFLSISTIEALVSLSDSDYRINFLKEIIISTSYGENTACKNEDGDIFKNKKIVYLNFGEIGTVHSVKYQGAHDSIESDYEFNVVKCIR